jgi:uncharacterized protein YdeI (YjbR/CyaY-like superfamily)
VSDPVFFAEGADFRAWLAAHHDSASEVLVGFWKVGSGKPSMTWSESVDEALCFGWIDGIKKRVDESRYTHRFTPRSASSTWSLINARRAKELIALKRMKKPGRAAWERRDPKRTGIYSFENRPKVWDAALEREFKRHAAAWSFFRAQPSGYQRLMVFYVMSAKRPETQRRRLDVLIRRSAEGTRLR